MTDLSSQQPAQHSDDEAVDAIVRAGPGGAIAVAAIATAIVLAIWFGFYLLVFLPRSA